MGSDSNIPFSLRGSTEPPLDPPQPNATVNSKTAHAPPPTPH